MGLQAAHALEVLFAINTDYVQRTLHLMKDQVVIRIEILLALLAVVVLLARRIVFLESAVALESRLVVALLASEDLGFAVPVVRV